jgi:hypothetical protein
MIFVRSTSTLACAILGIAISVVSIGALRAERVLSAVEQEIETNEIRTTIDALAKENAKLKSQLEQSDGVLAGLQKNLVVANSEAEVFKRQAQELKKRLEALGLDAAGGSSAKLEQRLLKAANDLKLTEDERKKLQEALIRLSEAVIRFQKVAVTNNPEMRATLEAEMRNAARALGVAPPETREAASAPATLQDAMVISIEEQLALVVANVGTRHGVKVGMPFQVLQGDNIIGSVRVVDVRENISGAVIQDLADKSKIQLRDRLKVAAQP